MDRPRIAADPGAGIPTVRAASSRRTGQRYTGAM